MIIDTARYPGGRRRDQRRRRRPPHAAAARTCGRDVWLITFRTAHYIETPRGSPPIGPMTAEEVFSASGAAYSATGPWLALASCSGQTGLRLDRRAEASVHREAGT